jgi:hypothetical protein
MTQPLHCSIAAPWGNHLTLRDNICPRCGWAAPDCSAVAEPEIEGDPAIGVPAAA